MFLATSSSRLVGLRNLMSLHEHVIIGLLDDGAHIDEPLGNEQEYMNVFGTTRARAELLHTEVVKQGR